MTTNPAQTILDWGRSTPDVLAIASAQLTMTYAEFSDAVRRTASKLRRLGVRPGHVVAIRARPEIEAVVTIAALHEGAISLHGSEAVLAAYSDEIDVLIGDPPRSTRFAGQVIAVDAEFMLSLGSVNSAIEPHPLDESDPCRVVFSSGTTGSPKGVAFTVASLVGRTASAERNWMPLHPFMCLLGLDTVSGFQTFAWSVLNGATYLVPGDGPTNLELMGQHTVRSIKTSPARLENLIEAAEGAAAVTTNTAESSGQSPAPALAEIQVAGSLLAPSLGLRCRAAFGITPTYLYGSTEVGTVTRGIFDLDRPNAVGAVVADAQLQLVDGSGTAVVGEGASGRIRYRSAHTPSAYWRGTSEANASFDDGWFYPGDFGAWGGAGELLISGRADDLVNAGGAKFNLAELDIWMAELDVFSDCASFQFRDAAGAVAIGLAFQSRNPVNPEVVLDRVRGLLPNLEIRALLRIDSIPRNQLGKVSRNALTALMGE